MHFGPRVERERATRGRSTSQKSTQQFDFSQDAEIQLTPEQIAPLLDEQDEQEVEQPLAVALPEQEAVEDGADETPPTTTHYEAVAAAPKRGRPRKHPQKCPPMSEDRRTNAPHRAVGTHLTPVDEASGADEPTASEAEEHSDEVDPNVNSADAHGNKRKKRRRKRKRVASEHMNAQVEATTRPQRTSKPVEKYDAGASAIRRK